jgi:hypothetical protein
MRLPLCSEGGQFMDTVPISESDRRKIAYDIAKTLYKPWKSARVVNPNPAET